MLPLSYAVDVITKVSAGDTATGLEMAALVGFLVVFLGLAAASMRRQTP
ncbi:hypothetical protein PAB09_01910 [Corynebacterium sp. SCR221107]|nr:hypothetical protein [Corynebacterium sp. SCR221107]WBT09120.1 hypothetical protein PAB09_01910 [Corynebacterium sp. SCR221107]